MDLPMLTKKPRKPRVKKGEIKLQSRLEKYSTTDMFYPNCWIVYKKEKQELLTEDKEERKKKKENDPKIDQIRGFLSEASHMNKWSTILQEQEREPQAKEAKNSANRSVQEACKIFNQGMPDEEKKELDDNELNCLANGIVPSFPYLCSKSDIREMEAKEKSLKVLELQKKIVTYEKMIEEEQAFAQELIREIENTLPFVQDKKQIKRLEAILEKMN